MDLTSRNTKQLLLVNVDGAAGTSTKPTGSYIRTYTDLNDGQIAITDPKGLSVANGGGTSGGLFKIVVRNGTNLYWTPLISGVRSSVYPYVSYARGHYYNAPVPQIDYIGYNGSTGSITVTNSNYYKVWIHMKELDNTGQGTALIKDGVYESTSADTQANIAYELTRSLINNWSREPWKDIYFGRTYSGAQTVLTTAAANYANWQVTKGSPYAVCVDGTTPQAHGLSVGNILSLASLAFVVTEVPDANTVKLDLPWQHDSGYCVANDVTATQTIKTDNANLYTFTFSVAHGVPAGSRMFVGIANNGAAMATGSFYSGTYLAATTMTSDYVYQGTANATCVIAGGTCAAGGNWGIRLHGASRTPYFVAGKVPYSVPMWDLFIEDFGATTITNSVTARMGTGTGYQIADEELFCQGFEKGNFTDQKDWLNTNRAHAVVTNNYDVITLSIKDEKAISAIVGQPTSFSEIMIAANHGTAHASIDAIEAILDDYLGADITIDS